MMIPAILTPPSQQRRLLPREPELNLTPAMLAPRRLLRPRRLKRSHKKRRRLNPAVMMILPPNPFRSLKNKKNPPKRLLPRRNLLPTQTAHLMLSQSRRPHQ